MARLELTLLGPLQARLGGEPITTFESNKVRALLVYLAVEADRAQRREILATLLWPDWPQQSALHNLSYALADLRKNLSDRQAQPPFLLITHNSLQLNRASDARVDLWEFTHLVNSLPGMADNQLSAISALKTAVDLYRGPFLEGFSLPDSVPYEEWLAATREQYKRQMLQCLRQLAELYESRGEYEGGLVYANRQIEEEPWREEGHQQVMRLLALSGRRTSALVQYEKCRQVLKAELGIEPGTETKALAKAIREEDLAEIKEKGPALAEDRRRAFSLAEPTPPPPEANPLVAAEPKQKHNLPIQRTTLVGRVHEVRQVRELLAQASLVTLTGSGGVGKTRLSLEAAKAVLDDFGDGVWYVELAALSEPELVPQQVAKTLGVREVPGQPILDSLTSFLRDRQVLLVLDNCEHLLDACSRLVDALLNASPRLKILTSSREPLGVAGEVIFRVPSLPFPAAGQSLSTESTMGYAALHLFVDRARLVRPGFQVTAGNTASLARICQQLDGIPLAIELAAARTSVLTLEQLASRLDDAFRLLTGGSRSALPRQQTLRATIEWSYQLLNDRERLLFQRLSVFAGGCTLEAAEAICSGAGLEAREVLDLLASLAAKSMVSVDFPKDPDADATRYRLLETVRQYAREKLEESGERASLHTRHLEYFLAYIETFGPKVYTVDWAIWRRKLEAEHDNLRLALEWSFSNPASLEAGLKLVLAMDYLWGLSYYLEENEWYKRAAIICQDHPGISQALYARFLGQGSHTMAFNDLQTSLSWNKQSVELARLLGPNRQVILIKCLLDLVRTTAGDLNDYQQAVKPFAEAEALLQQLGSENHPDLRAGLAVAGAALANRQGKYQEAISLARESIQIGEKLGWVHYIYHHIVMGDAYTGLGEFEQARSYYRQALHQADEFGDLQKAYILNLLGLVDFSEGYLDKALGYCQEGLKEAYAIPDHNVMAFNLDLAARIRAKQGRPEQAAHLSGAAHTLYERQKRLFLEHSALDAILPGWEGWPDRDAIWQAYEEGRTMSAEQAVDFVLHRL
jgi:predicted ATPase/DNA-binding SARP family transcriptional activator/Tfp pilus assembly protein PilF